MGDHDRQHLFRYLQGALSEEERKRVETHLDTCGECSDFLSFVRKFNATLKEMAGHELLPDTVCPDPETLAAFKAEELDEKAAQKVRVHTAFCKDCLDELYLLRQVDERSKLLKAEDTTPESLSVVAYKHSVCVLALYREVRNPDAQAAEDDDRL